METPALPTPAPPEATHLFNAARAARRAGRVHEAGALYHRLIGVTPDHADAHNNLGQLLLEEGKAVAAVRHLRAAVALAPALFHAHLNLGTAFDALEDAASSIHFARARRLCPDDPRGWNNIGNALRLRGEPLRAADALSRAAALDPADVLVWNNLASAWLDAWRLDRARAGLERVFVLRPGFAPAIFNRGLLHLAEGNWAEGWRDYGVRHAAGHRPARPFPQPAWTSGGPAPRSVVVWGEQGLGEEIMFAGVLPELPLPAGGVVVETDERLVPLFRRSFPPLRVVPRADPPDAAALGAEAQVALPDLAGMLRPTAQRFPARPGWLMPDAARAAGIRAALKATAGGRPLVGLAWRSANPTTGRGRSVPASAVRTLIEASGVAFVSLQARETDAERAGLPAPPLLRPIGIDLWRDIDGLAALIAALDLVVTVDTAVAHLAGALGLPTWVMLPANPEWRWRRSGARSLWYPAARLFRQDAPGDWSPVVATVGAALEGMEWP